MRLSPKDWAIWLAVLFGISLALLELRGSEVTFHTVDAETGESLEGVEMRSQSGFDFPTGRSGNLTLWLNHQPYLFEASLPGYENTNIPIDPGVPSCWLKCAYTVKLHPVRDAFIVKDAYAGVDIHGAKVSLDGNPIKAGEDGVFRVARVVKGEHLLGVRAAGYVPISVTVAVGSVKEIRNVELQPTDLCVTVTGMKGKPLAGAMIRVGNRAAVTEGDGTACLTRLEGPLDVSISHPAYFPTSLHLNVVSDTHRSVALAPRIFQTRLWDPWRKIPVAGATALAGGKSARSDENGRVVLSAVPISDSVKIQATGYLTAEVPLTAIPATVTLKVDGIRLRLVDALFGKPIAKAVVKHSQREWKGDDEGRVLLPHSVLGGHVTVSAPGFRLATVTVTSTKAMTQTMMPASLSGMVRDLSTGRPVQGARFYLPGIGVVYSKGGRYVLQGVPQAGDIKVLAPGYSVLSFAHPYPGAFRPAARCPNLPCADIYLKPFRVRSIYIPYGLLSRPEKVHALMKMVEDSPILNAVVVDAKGDHGYLAWYSKVPEATSFGAQGGKTTRSTFAWLLKEAKKKHIYVVARFVTFKDNPLATHKPDWAVRTKDGKVWFDGEGLGWGNPYLEDVQKYELSLLGELVGMGMDEIQLDYLRFPSDGDLATIKYSTSHGKADRTKAMRQFVGKVKQELQAYPVFLSVDTFGLTIWVTPKEDMNIGQRVMDLVPFIDYLCPMVYPSTFAAGNLGYENPSAHPYDVVFRSVEQARKILPPTVKLRPWLQGYWYNRDSMMVQREAAEAAGSWGWSYWNAGGVYDRSLFFPKPRAFNVPFERKYRGELEMKTLQCNKF